MVVSSRFVFVVLGTVGDALPFVALASELSRRGHAVRLLANRGFAELTATYRVPFAEITDGRELRIPVASVGVPSYVFPEYERVFAALQPELREGHNPIIVNSGPMDASNLFCEAHRLEAVRIYLAPFRVPSLEAPPMPLRDLPDPKAHVEAQDRDPAVLERINALRQSLGLRSVATASSAEPWLKGRIALFPEWFCPPASDWPPTRIVGFPLSQPTGEIPPQLEEFVETKGAPLVFTPGTAPNMKVEHFFEQAELCCDVLDRPGLFLSPKFAGTSNPKIAHFAFVDLAYALRKAALLVHHGGIGTTARGLHAGVPQLISPLVYDQYDNADRVERLGVGRTLPRRLLSADTLVDHASTILQDPSMPSRLQDVRARLVGACGVTRGAEALEAFAAAKAW